MATLVLSFVRNKRQYGFILIAIHPLPFVVAKVRDPRIRPKSEEQLITAPGEICPVESVQTVDTILHNYKLYPVSPVIREVVKVGKLKMKQYMVAFIFFTNS